MDLKQRFAEELRYLRELGREFAEDNPQLAQFLGDQAGDPDVERLLEGFAFLTAKLGMKIDDDLPELTHPLLQMLWPNYLRPLPSATIIRFTPLFAPSPVWPPGRQHRQCCGGLAPGRSPQQRTPQPLRHPRRRRAFLRDRPQR